jgi:hypothetical protein
MGRTGVDLRGPSAESSGVQDALIDACAEIDFSAEVERASVDRGEGGFAPFTGLEIWLAVPAAIFFKKFVESAADDAYKQMKSWTSRFFARIRAEANGEHIGLFTEDLQLYDNDEPDEAAYQELLAILRANPGLKVQIRWDLPRDPDGNPYVGASFRWIFQW